MKIIISITFFLLYSLAGCSYMKGEVSSNEMTEWRVIDEEGIKDERKIEEDIIDKKEEYEDIILDEMQQGIYMNQAASIWTEKGKTKEETLETGGNFLEIFEVKDKKISGEYWSVQSISQRLAYIFFEEPLAENKINASFSDDGYGNEGVIEIEIREDVIDVIVIYSNKSTADWTLQNSRLMKEKESDDDDIEEIAIYVREINEYKEKMGWTDVDFDSFIFETENRVFETEEIELLTEIQQDIFRNEIYARHGYIFTNQLYTKFFEQYYWYQPSITKEDFSYDVLSQNEKENLERVLMITRE